jgi:serine/threonine protein kinase
MAANRVGQRFGDYRLTRFLGQGTFGEVYIGEHVYDNTQVAVKVLKTQLTDKNDVKAFINEARTFRLKHPNIVQLLDFGIGDDDSPFLVMEYAPKGTLLQRHPKSSHLLLPTIVTYVKQIAAALQYAHNRRLIHRDVKPENMLFGANNEILLSDFGVAGVAHGTGSMTMQEIIGTVPYMAPEQLQGQPRPASDQYALGIIVYEWLCGERPFNGSAIEIAMQHNLTPPPPLRGKIPTISTEVEQVVMTALAKDPRQRFASVQAFANALEQASQRIRIPKGAIFLTYRGHSEPVYAVGWSSDGRHIFSSCRKTIQIWDAITGRKTATVNAPETNVRWLLDDKHLASASNEGVQVWNAITGTNILALTHSRSEVYQESHIHQWSPNGMHVAYIGGTTSALLIWDVTTNNHKFLDSQIQNVVWSPDGKRIASVDWSGKLLIWDANTGRNIRMSHDFRHALTPLGNMPLIPTPLFAWSFDGTQIALGNHKGEIHIWNANTGESVLSSFLSEWPEKLSMSSWPSNNRCINGWSPDSRYIARAIDKEVWVWDITTGYKVFSYRGHTDRVHAIEWAPDRQCIASAGADRTVHIWQAV